MEAVEKEGREFRNNNLKIGISFFAHDALMLAESLTIITIYMRILVEVAGKCDLEINMATEKCGLQFNKERFSII